MRINFSLLKIHPKWTSAIDVDRVHKMLTQTILISFDGNFRLNCVYNIFHVPNITRYIIHNNNVGEKNNIIQIYAIIFL